MSLIVSHAEELSGSLNGDRHRFRLEGSEAALQGVVDWLHERYPGEVRDTRMGRHEIRNTPLRAVRRVLHGGVVRHRIPGGTSRPGVWVLHVWMIYKADAQIFRLTW